MDIIAQSLVAIVAILGLIVLVATVSAVIVFKTVVKQSKSLVQVVWGDHRKTKTKDVDTPDVIRVLK